MAIGDADAGAVASSMTAPGPTSAGVASTPEPTSRVPPLPQWVRLALIALGAALLVYGAIAASAGVGGVSVAAVLAAGFAMAFVGYLGPYLTSIKFRDFEARLEQGMREVERQVERVSRTAEAAVAGLQKTAAVYENARAGLEAGGRRDSASSEGFAELVLLAGQAPPTAEELRRLLTSDQERDRMIGLATLRVRPDLWDFDAVLHALADPKSAFEHDRLILLSSDMIYRMSPSERHRLAAEISGQRGRLFSEKNARWHSSARLLYLLERADQADKN